MASVCTFYVNWRTYERPLQSRSSPNIGPPSLGLCITGPSGYDRYRQYHCCSLYQQTWWDPFPCPVAAASGSVSMATVSRYNHLGQTHPGLPKCDSKPVISAKPANHDRVKPPPQVVNLLFKLWGTPVLDMFATVHNTPLPQFMSPIPEP